MMRVKFKLLELNYRDWIKDITNGKRRLSPAYQNFLIQFLLFSFFPSSLNLSNVLWYAEHQNNGDLTDQEKEMVCDRFSQPHQYWHFGLDNFLLDGGGSCRRFSCMPGLYPLNVSSIPTMYKPNMSPDMAKCPMGHKIIPSWQPMVYGTILRLCVND